MPEQRALPDQYLGSVLYWTESLVTGPAPLADILQRDNRLSVIVQLASCFGLGCFEEDSGLSLSLNKLRMSMPSSPPPKFHHGITHLSVHCL